MDRFKFTNEISVMGVIQVVMLLVGLTAGAVTLQVNSAALEKAVENEVVRGEARDTRIRALETDAARFIAQYTERFVSMMTLLERIDKRLERIEGREQ